MTRELFPSRSTAAYDRYGRDLSEASRGRGSWVHDPSYALGTDDMVYEKVRRDAVTAQAMSFRKHLVAGRGVVVEPASDDDKSKRAAQVMEELLSQLCMFSQARFNLSEAVFRGSAFAFIEGQRQQLQLLDLKPQDWWVPYRLRDVDRRRFRLRPVPDPDDPTQVRVVWFLWSVARRQWEVLEKPEWFAKHFYNETEDTLSYGRGLLDSLLYYQSSKMRVLQEGLSSVERFGQGFLKVAIDGMRAASVDEANRQIVADYLDQLEQHRARNVLAHDATDAVELVSGAGEGWQLVQEMLAHLDNAIRTLILGSNLPTSATSGGSYALAEIQENSTEALIQFDRELLGETLTRDVMGLMWKLNAEQLRAVGLEGARMPVIRVKQEKREDPETTVNVVSTALASGIALRRDEVYDRLGFSQPQADDEVLGDMPAARGGGLQLPDLGGLLDSPAEPASAPEPQEPKQAEDTALNGAQVTALQGVIVQVTQGLLPAEAARELIKAGFPSIDEGSIARMVGSAEAFEPEQPAEPEPAAAPAAFAANAGVLADLFGRYRNWYQRVWADEWDRDDNALRQATAFALKFAAEAKDAGDKKSAAAAAKIEMWAKRKQTDSNVRKMDEWVWRTQGALKKAGAL